MVLTTSKPVVHLKSVILAHQCNITYIQIFRKAIPLCENDGIYVRDTQSGAVSI